MVPTCPFPARIAPSRTPTNVPIRASCDSKTFAPCRSLFGTRPELQSQKALSLSHSGFIARHYTLLCAAEHSVSKNTIQVQSRHNNSERDLTRSIFVSDMD